MSLPAILTTATLVVCVLLTCAVAVSGHNLTVVAALTCLISAIPILMQRRLDLFAPWNYMFYFLVLNVLIRSVLIDFGIDGGITDINGIFYLDKPQQFMVEAAAVMLLGFTFLTLGYLATPNRQIPLRQRIFRSEERNARRLKGALTVMLAMAGISFILFVKLTFTSVDEFAIGLLSKHRGLSEDLNEYRAYGYLRLLIGLAPLVVYLSYVRLRTASRARGYYRALMIAAILVSVAMAFYSQGRAALIFVFLNLLFIKYYLDGRRFPSGVFMIAAPMIVLMFVVISSFRGGTGVDLNNNVTPMTVVAPIILNNGGIDASKTGHVIDYTNDTQDYKFGLTLVQFVWATVPRQIWPSKPPNLDTYVGEKIYGAETYGAAAVPPGFLAEMYMNYWYAGIVVGALLLGFAMKRIQNVLSANWCNSNFVLVYVVVLQSLGMSMLSSGVSSTIMGALMAGVPLVCVLYFVTPKRRVGRVSSAVREPGERLNSESHPA